MSDFKCTNCSGSVNHGESFCRLCGFLLKDTKAKNPDELTGSGVANVFIGDGILIAAILLSVTVSSVSSMLWLLLLTPAFFFFGKGFSHIFQARQIRKKHKQIELQGANVKELSPPSISFADGVKRISGELVHVMTVTERTTRDLK